MQAQVKREPAPWIGVVVLAALACTLLDAVILERRYGIFAGGFLSHYRVTGLGVPYFFLGSLLVDASTAALLAAPLLWLTRRGRPATRLLLSSLLCVLVVQSVTVHRLEIGRFIGDTIQFRLAPESGVDTNLLGTGVLVLLAVVAGLTAVVLARKLPPRFLAPLCRGCRSPGRAVLCGATLVLFALVFLWATGLRSVGMQEQFARKTTGGWLFAIAHAATDFDGDGFNLIRQPLDPHPFDERFHPYAVDWPRNGLDENGIGGDLDVRGDFSFEQFGEVTFKRRPDVLLIVLETFRRDNMKAKVDGKWVTPVLQRLVREGALTGPAYSHNGFTIQSLTHLFTGSLTLTVATSLIDDFNANGYTTACVSGEDESFGDIERLTGLVRADHFVDARDNLDERTSASSASGSLTVPWTVVVRNVSELLEKEGGKDAPLFCYVNFQDCHFPYTHAAMKPMLTDDPIPRSEISRKNAEWIRRTYLNTAANVDHAVGLVLEAWELKRGRKPAFIIVSDHGESLYEGGVLGHGIKITREQNAIAFVVGGLDTECIFPLGHAQVRGLLRAALSGERGRDKTTIKPDRWIFQYAGSLDRPRVLGAAMAKGGVVHDFLRDSLFRWGTISGKPPNLARFWEQIRLHRAGKQGRTDPGR